MISLAIVVHKLYGWILLTHLYGVRRRIKRRKRVAQRICDTSSEFGSQERSDANSTRSTLHSLLRGGKLIAVGESLSLPPSPTHALSVFFVPPPSEFNRITNSRSLNSKVIPYTEPIWWQIREVQLQETELPKVL